MKISKSIVGIILLTISLSSCASLQINEAAATDLESADAAIQEIKDSNLVVIFPTYHKKEKALIEFSKTNPSVKEDLIKLQAERTERLEFWQNLKKEYYFSEISFVPDSLLKSYIAKPTNAQRIGENNKLEPVSLGDIYVLYTDYGGFEIKRNGQFIPNPFPNKVQAAWGSSIRDFLGVQSEEKSISRFFTELNRQLFIYYNLSSKEGN